MSINFLPDPKLALKCGGLAAACALVLLALLAATRAADAADPAAEAPLIIGKRTIHVFRAPLGAFTATERAEGARHRIARALEAGGAGWTSVKTTDQGVMVLLDGNPMFTVATADARKLSDETPEHLANAASRALQTVWREAHEARDPQIAAIAVAKVAVAALLLALALAVIFRVSRATSGAVHARLTQRREMLADTGLQSKIGSLLLGIAARSGVITAWLLGLMVIFVVVTYSLRQFVPTRPIGEALSGTLAGLLVQLLQSVAGAVPGMIVAVVIFMAAWVATQVSSEVFNHVSSGQLKLGMLDAHTAPATRRITNASLWLFALAMAYPYLHAAIQDAFNRHGVQIMSPHYETDPGKPKLVPEPGWYASPAVPPPKPHA